MASVGVLVVSALGAAVVLTRSPAKPPTHPTYRPQASALAPVQVRVVSEQGSTVTLQWSDPNHGRVAPPTSALSPGVLFPLSL
ncbi:MAG: hypothetical protein ACYC1D_03035 [Acidimicrobiales bacterium]